MNFMSVLLEIIPGRKFNSTYIVLDIIFLLGFMIALVSTKRYLTALFALAGGVIYFAVDYGIFYLLLGTRVVEGASYFSLLLWLSMSYGITNFAWIWLWIRKDKHLAIWSFVIVGWWISCGFLAQWLGKPFGEITIYRGTSQYHYIMALLLVIGYGLLIYNNRKEKDSSKKAPLFWLLSIGILVQFGWEFALLITGIRQGGIQTTIVNSLIETNMGIPYIYFIYQFITKLYTEDLTVQENAEVLEEKVAY